jgi:virginiamycin B lyase
MPNYRFALIALILSVLYGCSHAGTTTPVVSNANGSPMQTLSGVVHGNFTEYTLPSGANPTAFTKGPYSTLWFDQNVGGLFGNGFHVYRFSEGNGTTSTFSQAAPWSAVSSVLTVNALMYFIVLNPNGPGENPESLAHATTTGSIVIGPQVASDEQIGNLVLGPDGKIWFPSCVESCTSFENGASVRSISTSGISGVSVNTPDFTPNQMTPGPGGYMYVTASFTNALPPPTPTNDSDVFVISTAGSIVHQFALPHASLPSGIAVGSDHNLWITEPGINKIARMNPSTGTVTQFSIPTAGAQAAYITQGPDTATWFTETHGNKIGRITTTGSITEWSIPTANSGSTAINYCTTQCPPNGGVWFTETSANKIAKFSSPL